MNKMIASLLQTLLVLLTLSVCDCSIISNLWYHEAKEVTIPFGDLEGTLDTKTLNCAIHNLNSTGAVGTKTDGLINKKGVRMLQCLHTIACSCQSAAYIFRSKVCVGRKCSRTSTTPSLQFYSAKTVLATCYCYSSGSGKKALAMCSGTASCKTFYSYQSGTLYAQVYSYCN
jgi:hypothetical protein